MHPKFKDACIEMTTIIALDDGEVTDANAAARKAWDIFEATRFLMAPGYAPLTPESTAEFVSWWTSLSKRDKSMAIVGLDVDNPNDSIDDEYEGDMPVIALALSNSLSTLL